MILTEIKMEKKKRKRKRKRKQEEEEENSYLDGIDVSYFIRRVFPPHH